MDRCEHKWHVINRFDYATLKDMAKNPDYDPDLDDPPRRPTKNDFVEKVCLECDAYVDDITPVYERCLKEVDEEKSKKAKIDVVVVMARKGIKKKWER